jgi:CBS domain-containing protein
MRIGEVCTRDVVYCEDDASIVLIAQLMRDHHVGDVVVVEETGNKRIPVGIVTDRDLVVEVIAQGVAPNELRAKDLMRRGALATAKESALLYSAIALMRDKGIRRLPVVDADNALVGVLTADDVTEFLAEELTEIARIVPRQRKVEAAARPPIGG